MGVQHWDVIIVGAGPAGLALATRLASMEGTARKVLILERQQEQARDMRIGESLPGAARTLLQRLGVFDEFLAGSHLERGATVSIWDTEEPVWRDSLRDPAGPGWLLDRRLFEQILHNAALRSGAVIHYGCSGFELARQSGLWSLDMDNGGTRHLAPVIVDASGRSASLARRLGLTHTKQDSQICLHSFLPLCKPDEDTTTRILADRGGWWYSVRLASGYRVLAYHLDARDPGRQTLQQPETFLYRARNHPFLAEALGSVSAADVHIKPAGTSILDIARLDSVEPGFLVVGDASITFDPVSSQGLFHALASAESAAVAINAGCWHNLEARDIFKQELLGVASHYLAKLDLTYRGPERFAHEGFWVKRRYHSPTLLPKSPLPVSKSL